MDAQHLVLSGVLELFNTPEVEQNLSPAAQLNEDLNLSTDDIMLLGLTLEQRMQVANNDYYLSDTDITGWVNVSDIINTLKSK